VGIQHAKARLELSLKKKWEKKVSLGQYIRSIDKHFITEEDSFSWQPHGDIYILKKNKVK
jgi:hypothetical protein